MARGERTLIQWNAFAYYGELPSDRIETRYKVDQSPWSAWSTRRELSLREISSGSHTLEVQAKGLFGDLPVHGKTVDFEVLPPFYGRPAFYLPVGVLGSLLLTLGYLSRARERKFDRALREQDAAYRAVVEQQSELIFQILPNGALTFVNEAFCRFFSMRRDELLGRKFFDIISPEASREVMEKISRLTPEEPLLTVEAEVRRPEGNAWLNWTHKAIVDEHNNVVAFQSTGRDITDRKRFEDQLIASLKEKEVLLKEIHHRVKNNLQVISSLLNLQIGSLKDARDIEVFKESQNRVKSMALIHERLYQSGNLARIDFKEYLSSLVGHLSRSYPIGEVSFEEDVDELMLEIDTAIPCGLIVNELVSNALKHAFVGRSGGKVQVTLHALENQHCRLTVNDNGVGFPPGIEYRDASTLGLQLVNVLTGQLNGSLDITVANGTTFVITFPMKLQESIH
jgi:PAS domain S-box-containing protein